jgi:hypothetical protein
MTTNQTSRRSLLATLVGSVAGLGSGISVGAAKAEPSRPAMLGTRIGNIEDMLRGWAERPPLPTRLPKP